MDPNKKNEYKNVLLSLIPSFPHSIGNAALRIRVREQISQQGDGLADNDYWELRNSLIDDGLIETGRGRGGSVRRVAPAEEERETEAVLEGDAAGGVTRSESDLYEPFHTAVSNGYVRDHRITNFISEITASQGRRATGGRWTRPDVTLIAVRKYSFTPGRRLEVITFELKPNLDAAIQGVFEALAHSAFAHRSYLAVDVSSYENQDVDDRILQECGRLGVGCITFQNPADYETFDIISPAKLNEPDPYEVDTFIKTQISEANQERLRDFL